MRATNAGIDAVLAANTRFQADCYTFYFLEGTQRWTGADTSIAYGGNTWLATGPIMARGPNRQTLGLEVDQITITMVPGTRTIGSQTLKLAAIRGSFDNIRVVIQRAIMSTWGTVPGLITLFDGLIVGVTPGSNEIQIEVKSKLARLSIEVPRRIVQPQCQHLIYDSECGVTKASWTHTRTAITGSTVSLVKLSSSSTNANIGGMIEFTSGALDGIFRTIKAVSGVDCTLWMPLPVAPTNGDGLTVSKGCDYTRAACRTFSNIAKFGGFPDMPKPEAVAPPLLGFDGYNGRRY